MALLPFAMLALLSFTRPTEALLETQVPYVQHATLSYTAKAQPGPVYPNNTARTGDPLFTHVLKTVNLRVGLSLQLRGGTPGRWPDRDRRDAPVGSGLASQDRAGGARELQRQPDADERKP